MSLLGVTRLSLTFKLPLSFFQALEDQPEDEDMTPIGSSSTSKPPPVSARFQWKHLPSTLNHLTNLKALRLWLDHDKTSNWYVFNERLLREPFLDSLSLPRSPTSLVVVLPKLHPRYKKASRHFLNNKLPVPNSRLLRVWCQREHCYVNPRTGRASVIVPVSPF
jgi:hypothetical protein